MNELLMQTPLCQTRQTEPLHAPRLGLPESLTNTASTRLLASLLLLGIASAQAVVPPDVAEKLVAIDAVMCACTLSSMRHEIHAAC